MNRAARSKFREWWPECIGALFCFAICVSPGSGYLGAGLGLAGMLGIGWAMGHRHRRLPMQATLDGVRQDVTEVKEILLDVAGAEQDTPAGPVLRVVR